MLCFEPHDIGLFELAYLPLGGQQVHMPDDF